MKIYRNDKVIERNSKIGRYASMIGPATAIGVLVYAIMSFSNPDMINSSNQGVLLAVLFVSLIITQVSMYLGNRFNRKPRPDEALDAALKGIPGDYVMYHYSSPASHLLAGAAGLWVLMPYHQRGKVVYKKNRWKNFGGGFAQGYMRIFGQEGMGRPDLEADNEVAALEKFFKKKLGEGETIPPVRAALVFLDPNIEIEAEGAPLPAMQAKKLKEFIRKTAKENPFPQAELDKVKAILMKD